MTIADRRRPKVDELVAPQLQSGEQIESTLSFAQTGPSPWFAALTYFIFFMVKMKAVVVTNQRVIVVTKSFWTGRPQAVEATFPRTESRVLAYRSPTLWGKLVLQLGDVTLKLNVPRIHGAESDALVAALGGVSTPTS